MSTFVTTLGTLWCHYSLISIFWSITKIVYVFIGAILNMTVQDLCQLLLFWVILRGFFLSRNKWKWICWTSGSFGTHELSRDVIALVHLVTSCFGGRSFLWCRYSYDRSNGWMQANLEKFKSWVLEKNRQQEVLLIGKFTHSSLILSVENIYLQVK